MILVHNGSMSKCIKYSLSLLEEKCTNNKELKILYINCSTPDLMLYEIEKTSLAVDKVMQNIVYERKINFKQLYEYINHLDIIPDYILIQDISLIFNGSAIDSYLNKNLSLIKVLRVLKKLEFENKAQVILMNEYNRFLELNCDKSIAV